jgi:hypothetical protein
VVFKPSFGFVVDPIERSFLGCELVGRTTPVVFVYVEDDPTLTVFGWLDLESRLFNLRFFAHNFLSTLKPRYSNCAATPKQGG